jgi:hypothetical protein
LVVEIGLVVARVARVVIVIATAAFFLLARNHSGYDYDDDEQNQTDAADDPCFWIS